MQNLAFMVDISQQLNNLNKMLQGYQRLVTQYYDTIGCISVEVVLVEDTTFR